MPRTNYVPSMHRPVGYAHPYYTEQREDKPTIEVDLLAPGMEEGLIEAVIMALEFWEPTFAGYEDPSPLPPRKDGAEQWDTRRVPVFRGRHADRVLKFRDEIMRYITTHRVEPEKQAILRIAARFVHIRPVPAFGLPALPHHNVTPYRREIIRPYVRRSDPEWNLDLVMEARLQMLRNNITAVHRQMLMLLQTYDENRGTPLSLSYNAEVNDLLAEGAHHWEHYRLVAHYVQDVVDNHYTIRDPYRGLEDHTEEAISR